MTNKNDFWMQTYTGKKFYINDPKPEDIDIRDIAHALSLTCRFSGHCNSFYSVAEHSVRMVNYVYKLDGYQVKNALTQKDLRGKFALLHDAAKAYMTDMPKPIKWMMPEYAKLEKVLLNTILAKFGLDRHKNEKEWDDVMLADVKILATEKKSIMSPEPDNWNLPEDPYDDIIIPLTTPQDAERAFLEWANYFGLLK